jgi:4a-hydroxytetrahydrobiopterin dehydratase
VPIKVATDQEIQTALEKLQLWTIAEGKLHREYRFRDFVQAFGFMTQVALLAERAGHHPKWSNAYGRVAVDLTTHEAGGITQKDLDLAHRMERIAVSM